jgi:allantoinase
MKYDLLIRNGTVVREDRVERADVAVLDEKIVELAPEILGDARETIDATGLHVFPGVIDPHVHFNEPGRTEWEGFATGSAALAAGGGTLFFDMPLNSSPPVLDGESFDLKLEAARRSSLTDFALWGGLTPNNLDRMEELAERGVVGFKAFMCDSGIEDFPAADDYSLYRGMQNAARLGLIVAVHAENDAITVGLAADAVRQGRVGPSDYTRSRPVFAEYEAVTRAVEMALDVGCRLHVVHASCFRAAAAAWVRMTDEQITYETCPHYLVLHEHDLPRLGAKAKCAPPLRSADEGKHWTEALQRNEVPFVASDHSPSPPNMKQSNNYFDVWGGVAGVQSTRAILLTLEPPLGLESVSRLTATNVARRFDIESKGEVRTDYDADFSLVDLDRTFELKREDLLDRHKLSPYVGRTFRGVVRRTILRGRTIFRDGKVVGPPAGRFVRPAR